MEYDSMKVTNNGNQKTMYHCDGTRNMNGQPMVEVPMVTEGDYPVGMKPQMNAECCND